MGPKEIIAHNVLYVHIRTKTKWVSMIVITGFCLEKNCSLKTLRAKCVLYFEQSAVRKK